MYQEADSEFEPTAVVDIEEIELETIATALRVRTGLKAGLQPCL
jgi:hypothetical protein